MKSSLSGVLLLGSALAAMAQAASAQTTPAPPTTGNQTGPSVPATPRGAPTPAPAPPSEGQATAVEGVTVTARANDIRTSIDAISYSVGEDLQAATGTLADALRNIPSVDVDPQGNVSLRGDPGVMILVDGRSSGLFSGEGRGQAILQASADQYARIEVMTNPSAAYRPDGAGGVINLITRPNRPRQGAAVTGSIRANIGDEGRYNLGTSLSHTRDKLTLSSEAGLRHDYTLQQARRVRERLDPMSGQFLESRQTQDFEGDSDALFVRLSAEYRLDEKTVLTGEIGGNRSESDYPGVDLLETDDLSGVLASSLRRTAETGFSGRQHNATARVLRRFDDQGHEWSNELRYFHNYGEYFNDNRAEYLLPVLPSSWDLLFNVNRTSIWNFASAYTRPMAGGSRLRMGYELELQDVEFQTDLRRGATPATAVLDPFVSNRFSNDQQLHALYATLERPFGKLTAQFGLRLEYLDRDLRQLTLATRNPSTDFSAYPTLHLSYELAANQTLRGSYSRRVQRPSAFLLNPFPMYSDALNYSAGNPDLDNQITDSFELMWQRRVDQTFYQATLYYRDTSGAFATVVSDVGGVLISRPENLGARTNTGLELVANGRLHATLRYNASLNAYREEIQGAVIAGGQDRSGTTLSGRLTLNWQPTEKDFVQVSGLWVGDSVNPQGVREGGRLVNLGYRRTLTASTSLNVTVRDLFDEFGESARYDTPTLRDRVDRHYGGRMAFIGLTWSFGQGQRRPEQFDFSAPSQGG